MDKVSISEIAKCIGAEFKGDDMVDTFCTDSREVTEGCVFVAIEGERVDGHKYILQALNAGAAYAIAHKSGVYPSHRVLYVKNTRQVLLDIAKMYRNRFEGLKVVGVTGSVGKTTTKEFIWAVMSSQYKTLKSEGNKNTEIGLPQTVFGLDETYEAAVLEMGMCALGEIAELSVAAQPDIGVITNIGVSHLEKLGTRENILRAKLEILKGMKQNSPLIICGDCDLLKNYRNNNFQIIKYGLGEHNQIRATNITEYSSYTDFQIVYNSSVYNARIKTIGNHNVLNALAAFAVGIKLDIAPEQCVKAFENFETSGMRQKIVEHLGFTVVEDCYNANPDSMRAAMETLAKLDKRGKSIAVLGDMLELGSISAKSHTEIGKLVAQLGIDRLFVYGMEATQYIGGARIGGMSTANCKWFSDKDELAKYVRRTLSMGDIVWVKASRGMAFEEILNVIYDK